MSTDIILSSHMLYKLCCVKKRLQASSGEAIKFKCSFEVRKHWLDWSLDERKPFWFDSKAVRGPEKRPSLLPRVVKSRGGCCISNELQLYSCHVTPPCLFFMLPPSLLPGVGGRIVDINAKAAMKLKGLISGQLSCLFDS